MQNMCQFGAGQAIRSRPKALAAHRIFPTAQERVIGFEQSFGSC